MRTYRDRVETAYKHRHRTERTRGAQKWFARVLSRRTGLTFSPATVSGWFKDDRVPLEHVRDVETAVAACEREAAETLRAALAELGGV